MQEPVHLFTDLSQYLRTRRSFLPDILRPFVNDRTIDQNRDLYGPVVDLFTVIDQLEQADFAVLPYTWNYYYHTKQTQAATNFIHRANEAGKPVITWSQGDFGARVLDAQAWVFSAAGYKRSAGKRRFGVPVFIRDPLREWGFAEFKPRPKLPRPLIGFCGYALLSPAKSVGFTLYTLARNLASALHWIGDEPQDLYPPVLLRQRVLETLRNSPIVDTDFIQRENYQAGVSTPDALKNARELFFNNVHNTDYTVCVRGSGNFSARLYETLAMGRIPIFVDTDCLLPYADDPRWKQCCVYLRQDQISDVPEIVTEFHKRLTNDEFVDIQYQARLFWQERLSIGGFLSHFMEHFHNQPDQDAIFGSKPGSIKASS